jgi:hypothetical protein
MVAGGVGVWVNNVGYRSRSTSGGLPMAIIDQQTSVVRARASRPARPRRVGVHRRKYRGALLMAGLAIGAGFSFVSLTINAFAARLADDGTWGAASTVAIAIVTTGGACVATWFTQPAIARLLARSDGQVGAGGQVSAGGQFGGVEAPPGSARPS